MKKENSNGTIVALTALVIVVIVGFILWRNISPDPEDKRFYKIELINGKVVQDSLN